MPVSLTSNTEGIIAGLSAILLSDSGVDVTAENIETVVKATGNKLPSYYAPLFASVIEKAGGMEKFFAAPGSGGGGAAPAAAAGAGGAAPAAKEAEKPKVEEVDALDGGMDMFGGGGGGGGGDY